MSLAVEPVARRRGPMGRREVLVDGLWVADEGNRHPPEPVAKRTRATTHRTYVPRPATCNHCGSEFMAAPTGRVAALGPCCKVLVVRKPPHERAARKAHPKYLDVLEAVCRLGGNAAAAHALGISEQTVKNHLTTAYKRLGVVTAAQAAWKLWHPDAPKVAVIDGALLERLKRLVEEFER